MPKIFFIYFGGNKQTSRDAKQHYLISVAVCVIRTWNGTPVCVCTNLNKVIEYISRPISTSKVVRTYKWVKRDVQSLVPLTSRRKSVTGTQGVKIFVSTVGKKDGVVYYYWLIEDLRPFIERISRERKWWDFFCKNSNIGQIFFLLLLFKIRIYISLPGLIVNEVYRSSLYRLHVIQQH